MKRALLLAVPLLATGLALADDTKEAKEKKPAPAPEAAATEAKTDTKDGGNLGMSILGNQEAPKALVIVPWKSSELGASLGISTLLDDSRQPVDKEVFMRSLNYYEIRSETTHHVGAPAGGREPTAAESGATQPATATHRRKS